MSMPIASFIAGIGLSAAKGFSDWRQQKKEQAAYASQVEASKQQQQQQQMQFATAANEFANQQAATQAAFNKIGSQQALAMRTAIGDMQRSMLSLQQQNQAGLQANALAAEQARQAALSNLSPAIDNPGSIRGLGTTYTSPLGDESTPNLGRRKLLGN